MTMHYELKGRHEVCFKAKIWLTGLIVNIARLTASGASETEKATPGFLLT